MITAGRRECCECVSKLTVYVDLCYLFRLESTFLSLTLGETSGMEPRPESAATCTVTSLSSNSRASSRDAPPVEKKRKESEDVGSEEKRRIFATAVENEELGEENEEADEMKNDEEEKGGSYEKSTTAREDCKVRDRYI